MKKKDFIERLGREKYDRMLKQSHEWHYKHPDRVRLLNQKLYRKGGKYYEEQLANDRTGLRGARKKTRARDRYRFKRYKRFFAQESQIHHQWVPGTAEYTGIALVEKVQHMHSIIDVIIILDGEITLLTEERHYS